MIKLRRVYEATDSSHTSIMYNLADTLRKKGMQATYSENKGVVIDFTFDPESAFDPKETKEGKEWLKANPGKDFVFKGWNLKGFFCWDIVKNNAGKRELITKDLTVKGEKNLIALQKKLKAPSKVDGKLTGKSAKPFTYPDPYTITNIVSPAFQNYLKKLYARIIADAALALSEVVETASSKKESSVYTIEYDDDLNRVYEGYVTEANSTISWKDPKVQKAIEDAVKGLKVNPDKTTEKELIFTYRDKNGSLHTQGYMLVLDTDTDDNIPPTSYPIKDKGNLTLDNLLSTVKTVFSRRNNTKTESHFWDDDVQSDEFAPDIPEPSFYILKGDEHSLKEFVWNKGLPSKDIAIRKAKDLANNNSDSIFAVVGPVDERHFTHDTFWEALDDGEIEVVWKSDIIDEKRVDEGIENLSLDQSPVLMEVAKERFLDKLSKSLMIAPKYTEEHCIDDVCDGECIGLYLNPSYSMDQLSDIIIPLCIKADGTVTLVNAPMPDPNLVFGDEIPENCMDIYDDAVQNYIDNDAPVSDIAKIDLDNSDEVKAMVVDFINQMSGDYLDKRSSIEDSANLKGESLLKESRYFIVPSNTDLSSNKEVVKITPFGFTDLAIARNNMKELSDSGRYTGSLSILDTNFSSNKEKWEIL